MKSRIIYFSVLAILLSALGACSKKPETIVSELYKSIYDGEWEKAAPMILPDSLENLTPDEIKFLAEEFNRYYPEGRTFETVKVDSASYNEEKNEIAYTVTVNFNDSTSFTETGSLKKNAEGNWKLTDYMPKEGEKIPFEITLFDFPIEMKPNLKRAMIMLGAERNLPEYQYYAAPYYLYAPYPVDREKFVDLIKKASDANYIPAMKELADRYNSYFFEGKIMTEKYLELTQKMASLGDLEAKARLAWYQRDGSNGFTKDLAAAQKAFQDAYDAGIAEGAFGLGYMTGQGEIGNQDRAKALAYYKEAAELGHKDAAFNVYLYYSKGWGTKRDWDEGVRLEQEYRDKALGFNRSLYEPKDPKLNFDWNVLNIKKGDIYGNSGSYFMLGRYYEFGEGVEQDLEKAKYCYRRDAALRDDYSRKDQIRSRGFEKNPVIPIEEFKEIYK